MVLNIRERIEKLSTARKLVIVIFILLVAITLWGFIRTQIHDYRFGLYPRKLNQRTVDPTYLINNIQPWMSFDYLNYSFQLPPDYLRNSLNIADQHYPRLVIGHYAKSSKIDVQKFIQNIKQLISSYKGISQ